MNPTQAILNAVLMLSFLIVIGDEAIIIVRIFFGIGKQMAFVAGNNDFPPCRRYFIRGVLKGASKYL